MNALDANKEKLLPQYDKNKLYCPECMIAKLKFTEKTNQRQAFLSTKQESLNESNQHGVNCSHRYPKASRRMIQEHYENLNDRQIEDKLKATINWFLRRNEHHSNKNLNLHQADNPAVVRFPEKSGQIVRRIPTKNIKCFHDIDEEDYGLPFILYGDVKLSVEEHNVVGKYGIYTLYQLYLYDVNNGRQIRFFNRGKRKDDVEENVIYHFAAIVVYGLDKNNKLTCTFYNDNAVLFSRA